MSRKKRKKEEEKLKFKVAKIVLITAIINLIATMLLVLNNLITLLKYKLLQN